MGLSNSYAKKVLNNRFVYTDEVRRASQMYQRIGQITSVSSAFRQLRQDIQANIVNQTLRTNLLRHLDNGDKAGMLDDLADYYHLLPKYLPTFYASTDPAETFAWDALGYLRRNPHKPNWALRQVLKTEQVDPNLKEDIRNFLKQDEIPLSEADRFINVLRIAYQQYSDVLAAAEKDPTVQETVNIYSQLANEMEVFTVMHNRAPRWDIEEERDLYNRFETLLYQNKINQFELILPYLEKLYTFAEEFPLARLDEATTLKDVKDFVEKYGELPQGVRMREFLTQRPGEPLLYESMLYWQKHSSAFFERINIIAFSKDNFPNYPVYY